MFPARRLLISDIRANRLMAHVLLLGAGFSRNWGGWTTDEVFGDLAGRVSDDAFLQSLLNRSTTYEDALAKVQNDYVRLGDHDTRARLDQLQSAIRATFDEMNLGFAQLVNFEFQNPPQVTTSVSTFLAQFDAIFTLNQDLLLELHYFNNGHMVLRPNKWSGYALPGTEPVFNPSSPFPRDRTKEKLRVTSGPFSVSSRLQPYYKLHGSTDWVDHEGSPLLVMGGNKIGAIQRHPILTWYSNELSRYLTQPNTRLMVIGYGFKDSHINNLICEAAQRSQLQVFIVNTDGRHAIKKANPTYGAPIYCPEAIEEIALIGESMRQLSETFSGKDTVEHRKLMRFFRA